MYHSLIRSAVPLSIVAPYRLALPSVVISPGDLLGYDPADPYVILRTHAIPIAEYLAGLEQPTALLSGAPGAYAPASPLAAPPSAPGARPGARHLRLIR